MVLTKSAAWHGSSTIGHHRGASLLMSGMSRLDEVDVMTAVGRLIGAANGLFVLEPEPATRSAAPPRRWVYAHLPYYASIQSIASPLLPGREYMVTGDVLFNLNRDGWTLFGTGFVRCSQYGRIVGRPVFYLVGLGLSASQPQAADGDARPATRWCPLSDDPRRSHRPPPLLIVGAGLMAAAACIRITTNVWLLICRHDRRHQSSGGEVGPFCR